MWVSAHCKQANLCTCLAFNGGVIVGFITFPMLFKILHRPALDLVGTPASSNILKLVEWGFFAAALFIELICPQEIFQNLPLSDLCRALLRLQNNFLLYNDLDVLF